eukprot:7384726-Prymnesium_polylepis.1
MKQTAREIRAARAHEARAPPARRAGKAVRPVGKAAFCALWSCHVSAGPRVMSHTHLPLEVRSIPVTWHRPPTLHVTHTHTASHWP